MPIPGSAELTMQTDVPWSEVHIRRLDKDSWLHRRVVAAVEIDHPPGLVWDVLTDYSRLPEFFPHLLSCQVLPVALADFERYALTCAQALGIFVPKILPTGRGGIGASLQI